MPVILLERQDGQDAEDRDRVGEHGERCRLEHRHRDVALRVLHLLGGAVLQLEADVVEEQQRHEAEEDGTSSAQVAGAEAVDAVLDPVDRGP